MEIFKAIVMLTINFIKAVFVSGFETAMIILKKPEQDKGGLTEISYDYLNENTASLLGALITLTPGTTLVDIDTEKGVLVVHMLDLESREEAIQLIQRDYCDYLKTLNGVMS